MNLREMKRWRVGLVLASCLVLSPSLARGWDADAIGKHSTIRLHTNCPGEGIHSFPVWVVSIGSHVFVRLGSRAAARVECSPSYSLGVDVGSQHYQVRGYPAPELADRVAQAMAAKYSGDVLVRWFSHPLTLRLQP